MSPNDLIHVAECFHPIQVGSVMGATPISQGLINETFKVSLHDGSEYILQRVNEKVFQNPALVQSNILEVSEHLAKLDYPKINLTPIRNRLTNELFVRSKDIHWRLFDFVPDSSCLDIVQSEDQAFEAAKALGEFHVFLSELDPTNFESSIPGFLDFQSRINMFQWALKNGIQQRIALCSDEIEKIKANSFLYTNYQKVTGFLSQQIIHADPKISNFLFEKDSCKVLGLIDWDTLMRGSVLYDFGEMIRSFTNQGKEDDADTREVFSIDIFSAVKEGYLVYQKDLLTAFEIEHMVLGSKAVIYIQAIRFLTDYLLGDVYYSVTDGCQNRDRARNQINLLEGICTAR